MVQNSVASLSTQSCHPSLKTIDIDDENDIEVRQELGKKSDRKLPYILMDDDSGLQMAHGQHPGQENQNLGPKQPNLFPHAE